MFDVKDHVCTTGRAKQRVISCKYCSKKLPDSKERWLSHLKSTCVQLPDYVKSSIPKKRKADQLVKILSHSESGGLTSSGSSPDKSFLDELNRDFASVIYSTGVPFIFADHPEVRRFLQKLKPSWKPPSSKVIAGSLLLEKANSVANAVDAFMAESKYLSLVSDGWSYIRREHMVNYIAVTPSHKLVLICTENTTGISQDASEIAGALGRVIEQVGVLKVAGVVTDNAPNMVAAWKILEEKYPSVIVNGCGAHTINLLVKDICKLPEYQKWLDAARDITGFIMGRGSLRKRLEKIQAHLVEDGEMEFARVLVYVAETRWYTHHLCVRRLLDNKKAIVQLVGTSVFDAVDSSKKSVVVGWISDSLFWTTLSAIESDLRPTSKYVGILEADTCCLSDVYRCFVEMTSAYQGRPQILPLIESRWAFVHTESMSMAYYLDPRTKAGLGMIGDDCLEATDNIINYAIDRRKLSRDEVALKAEIDRFASDMAHQSEKLEVWLQAHSPREYWLNVGRNKYPLLYLVADVIFSIPSSQAASERVWSIYDFIHGKRRNRLSAEKVTALVQSYINGYMTNTAKTVLTVLTGEESDASGDGDDSGEAEIAE